MDTETGTSPRRRGVDLLTLVAGLAALVVAGGTLFGSTTWLPDIDGRWMLASVAMVVGLLLVIGSFRPRQR